MSESFRVNHEVEAEFHAPESVEEACAILAASLETATVVAGGIAVLNLIRMRLIEPRHLVSLHRVPGLRFLRYDESDGLQIGALTTHRDLEQSKLLRDRSPMLSDLAGMVAGVQIRNRATVGGSIVHADPTGDLAPGLISLRAFVLLQSSLGSREVKIDEFLVDYYETVRRPDELATLVRVPPLDARRGGYFLKYWTRTPSDFAVMNIGCSIAVEEDQCTDISIGLGGVHRRAFRPVEAEEAIRGATLTKDGLRRAGEIAAKACSPVTDIRGSADYKREMVRTLLPRAVEQAVARAKPRR